MKFIITATLVASASAAFAPDFHLTSISRVSTTAVTPKTAIKNERPTSNTSSSSSLLRMTFLDNLPNPFAENNNDDSGVQPRPPTIPPPISNEPDALFSRAKAIVASDLGLRDPSILAEDFEWVGPNVVSTGTLNREEYLSAGQFFNLRKAFPDLDYRAHDFRLDPRDPNTVRLTARTVGTFRGELRLRSETIPPNGNRMICPPEAISITFDPKSGKMVKLCSGFCMDRLVGNTGGLCGVMAAATVAGSPPSEWELYPPSVVVSRFFKRSVPQLKEPDQFFLAPFPESVMIQLAKGVLAADTGTKDPDLLSNDFSFCGPFVGPLSKDEFIDEFTSFELRLAYPDLDENYSNFRVDPYDPYRVWYDVKATGTRTGVLNGKAPDGSKYVGPPECASMTFDDDGFCTRMTSGAVMDPTDCNTGGLGGLSGILYASGVSESPISARPLPQILSRIQKGFWSPLTGKGVDDFASVDIDESKTFVPPTPPQPPIPQAQVIEPVETTPVVSTPPVVPPTIPQPPKSQPKTQPQDEKESSPPIIPPNPFANIVNPLASSTNTPPAEVKKPEVKKPTPTSKSTISSDPSDPVTDVLSSFFGTKSEATPQPVKKATPVTPAANKAKEAQKKEAEEKRQKALAAAEAKRKEAEAKRARALAAAEEKRKQAEEKRNAMLKAKEAEKVLSKAKKPSATISLGFFGFGQNSESDESKGEDVKVPASKNAGAPRGVPTLRDWRRNNDGSLTGLIYNSRVFGAGESITTSPLQGNPSENSVVATKSGSKYYLEKKSVVGGKSLFSFGGGGSAVKKDSKPKGGTAVKSTNTRQAANRAQAQSAAAAKKAQIATNKAKADAAARRKQEQEAANIAKLEAAAKQKEAQEAAKRAKAEAAARKREEQEEAKQAKANAMAQKKEQQEAAQRAKAEAAAKRKEEQEAAQSAKAEAAAKRKEEQEAARKAKAEAAAKKKEEQEAARKAKAEAAAKKKEEQEAARKAKAEAAEQKKLEAAKKLKEEAIKKAAKKQAQTTLRQRSSGTISLGSTSESSSQGLFSFGKNEKKPPAGVPVLTRWKKNSDGSITGMVSGSKAFKEGEKVTTSPLARGQTVAAGNVVSTASGSKYFLK